LFRIFQESMNNIVRHANASTARIKLWLEKNKVQLEIQDDGAGFQLPADWVDLAREGHLGLVGMRERAEALGGRIVVSSGECSGTTIQVEIPCELRKAG
jgi:signal transduction histidine kinase